MPDSLAHPRGREASAEYKGWAATAKVEGLPVAGPALWRGPPPAVAVSLAGCAAMRIIGVDHTGPEPVLVVDFGDRVERWSMDQVRSAAVGAPAWLPDWVNKTTREEEVTHAQIGRAHV